MKQHILVVDDEPGIRYPIVFVLSNVGFEVAEASDGLEALTLILDAEERGEPFDLVLTDIQVPGMSGTELIQELKWNEISLPIIIISGTKDEDMMQGLLNNGCSGFLMKPFDIGELIRQVDLALERPRKRRSSYRMQTS